MAAGHLPRWIPIAVALALVSLAGLSLGDRLVVHQEDEEAFLVGEPSRSAKVSLEEGGPFQTAGTYKHYTFPVEPVDNRLEIDLVYDPGPVSLDGLCLRANDLDLFVEGPSGYKRAYPGCDGGHITILDDGIPQGDYTVRVEAKQGTTLCVPSVEDDSCEPPEVDYRFELKVWELG